MAERNPRWEFEMPASCSNCPFIPGGIELRPGRLEDIHEQIRRGETFCCHKSIDYSLLDEHADEEGRLPEHVVDPGRRGCAGARVWARQNGCTNVITRYFDLQEYKDGVPNAERELHGP